VKLSILIPVYNEEDGVRELIQRVAAVNLGIEKEIIVVDDCSTDNTASILAGLNHIPGLRVIRHEINRGKGAGIRTALAAASGDLMIIQDADLEYDPNDFPQLLAPILAGQAQVVYGVRDLSAQKLLMRWGNRFLTLMANLIYGCRLHDMETCYKMMTLPIARALNLQANRFDIEPEITAKILRMGHRIVEVPIWYSPRTAKKLSPWRDGWPALRALLRFRFWRP